MPIQHMNLQVGVTVKDGIVDKDGSGNYKIEIVGMSLDIVIIL